MTDRDDRAPVEAPRPPGVPEMDLDVPLPDGDGQAEVPDDEDDELGAGVREPPD